MAPWKPTRMAMFVNESLLLESSFAVNRPVPDYQLLETAELSTKALAHARPPACLWSHS
jgi:hypothetical protein